MEKSPSTINETWVGNHREGLPYRQTVSCLVVNDFGEFLLAQKERYQEDQWELPGGGIEDDESVEAAAMRELKEELGSSDFVVIERSKIDFKYEWPIETTIHHCQKTDGELFRGQSKLTVIARFVGKDKDLKVQLGEGLRRIKWVSPEELEEHLVFPGQFEFVSKVIKEAKNL